MSLMDALLKLGRVLDSIERDTALRLIPVPVALRAENSVMARMRGVLLDMDSQLSAACYENTRAMGRTV